MNNRRQGQISTRWIIGGSVAVFLVVAIVFLVLRYSSPLVVVSEAVEGPVVQAFYSTGTIQPDREFPIKANVAGILTEIRVDKGDSVNAGQTLAVVSERALQFAARQAEAELSMFGQ